MLRGLWALLVFVAITIVCATPVTLVSLARRNSNIVMRAGRVWSRVMLTTVGARVNYVDLENSRAQLPCIYIANHASNVDIWVLMSVLPDQTRFVAKRSLFRIPFLGWALSSAGFVPVDRGHRTRAIKSLGAAARVVRNGRPLVLFPEGTRSRDGRLQRFKKGPFHLALQAGVPIMPVAIRGSFEVLPPGRWRVSPGPVEVRFLPPVDVSAYAPDDYQRLMVHVRNALAEALAPAATDGA